MAYLDFIKKVAFELKSENLKGANYVLMKALSSLRDSLHNFRDASLIQDVETCCNLFFQVQPTMALLANSMALFLDKMKHFQKEYAESQIIKSHLIHYIDEFIESYRTNLTKIAKNASTIIPDRASILTYSFSSTVFQTIKLQKKLEKDLEFFITESRPNNEGILGAQELSNLYPTTLFVDAGMGYILKEYSPDLILIGADSFTPEELIHKIGTLALAVAAHEFDIPLYSLTHSLKFYNGAQFGIPIPIEDKPVSEITDLSKENLQIKNYYFDRTPMKYIKGIITEDGILTASTDISRISQKFPLSILEKLYRSING